MTHRNFLAAALMFLVVFGAKNAAPEASQESIIRPFVRGSFPAIIKEERGRPHIINFWSIGCPPCLAEMPLLGRVLDMATNARLTMVSTDSKEDLPRIRRILAKWAPAKARFWVFADTFTERLRYDVDKSWSGELPRTYLVGIDGTVEAISGVLHETFITEWLERQK